MEFDVNENGEGQKNIIKLKDRLKGYNKISVLSLFENNVCFCIPSYQRGYRWKEKNVKKLLEDINAFFEKWGNDTERKYSLNPIILSDREDEKLYIVDGQQRLTTLFILCKFLGVNIEAKIKYEVRNDSENFLNDIVDKANETMIELNDKNCIDYDYFLRCYKTIKDYIEKDGENKREDDAINSIKEKIKGYLNRIDYYVYFLNNENKVAEKDEIETFKRINKNKIKMLDAELVKSLFVEMSSRQNVKEDKYDVAFEWDRIENKLQNNDFWYFICPNDNETQDKKNIDLNCRIQFILEIVKSYKENEKTDNNKRSGKIINNENELFDFFEKYKDDRDYLLELWKEVLKCFATLEDWYNDFVLYHYLGFVFNIANNLEECIIKVKDYYKEFRSAENRDGFIVKLKKDIGDIINKDIEKICDKKELKGLSDDKCWENLGETSIEENKKGDKTDFRKLLLLFNIQYMINRGKSFKDNEKYGRELFERFSFYHYKKEKWDIEHIFPNDIGDLKEDKNRMDELLKDIIINHQIYKTDKNGICNEDIENIMKYYKNNKHKQDEQNNFDKSIEKVFQIIRDLGKWKEEKINSLKNFCLLDASTNRAYGNNIFSVKRRWIIGRLRGKFSELGEIIEKNNCQKNELKYEVKVNKEVKEDEKSKNNKNNCFSSYVLPITEQVFLKGFTKAATNIFIWTEEDGQNYFDVLKETIEKSGINIFRTEENKNGK